MSNNIALPWEHMRSAASVVCSIFGPACHRIEVAGSLRRMKPQVRDIEIVAIPKPDIDLFGNALDTNQIDYVLQSWPAVSGVIKSGAKYKQFKFIGSTGSEYVVDLFLQPDPLTWPVNFLLRTGSAEFSHKMVTPQSRGGFKPDHLEIREARVWDGGTALELKEEEEIFELWGMNYVKPRDRK